MKEDRHGLIKVSIVLLILFNISNVLNFVFQFFMAHVLSVSEYGILAALTALAFVLYFFYEAIQAISAYYVSRTKSLSKINSFIRYSFKYYTKIAIWTFFFYLIISFFVLSPLLKINFELLAINGLTIFIVFLSPILLGALQGTKRFTSLGWNMVFSSVIRLVSALIFVFIGWRVGGAVLAMVIGGAAGCLIAFIQLKEVYSKKHTKFNGNILDKFNRNIFLIFGILFAFYSFDIIIAKIVFEPLLAGYYSIASVLAKTIFVATQPISRAMLPFSTQTKTKSESRKLLIRAGIILVCCALLVLLLFYFLPDFLIKIFSGKLIPNARSILVNIGIAVSLISIANLVCFYKISLGKTKGIVFLALSLVIESIVLSFFSTSILAFSEAFIISSIIFLFASTRLRL